MDRSGGEVDRRDRAERLFEELRSLDPVARAARIGVACAGDETLRAELESLLAHAEAGEEFFELLGRVVLALDIAGGLVAGRYEVRSCIGAGGMGEVYRARDRLLERDVALKFLTAPVASGMGGPQRLLREARAAAALEHTNVCTVHEVGETADGRFFLSMAFYDGQALKERLLGGPLPVADAVAIARQIARGLGAAHAHGIVHRDVKPGNVMILPDGTVKLLDFGLARSSDAARTVPADARGTVAYMSPEQVRGEDVDGRSDLFSLGVVLQEMLTGVNPFRRGTDAAVLQAILHDEPEPLRARRPAVPAKLQRVVTRLLQKRAGERYAGADALIGDLDLVLATRARSFGSPFRGAPRARTRFFAAAGSILLAAVAGTLWLGRGAASSPPAAAATATAAAAREAGRKTVAVLPFANVSRDPEDDYLVDGLTDELIGALSRVRSLSVVARTSAFTFKDATVDVREIGRALNVAAIVEGSVQKVGEHIVVRAQLIDATDGMNEWSGTFDAEFRDILTLQRELALRIAAELETELTADVLEQLGRRPTTDPEAYAHYLKGRHLWNQRTPGGFSKALEYYQRAIDLDPGFAAAHAGMATAYSLQGIYSQLSPSEARARMRRAAVKAVELDSSSAEARSALGVYHHVYEWDSASAEREQLRAIDLDPGHTTTRYFYGNLLRSLGRFEEALAQYEFASGVDPLDPHITEALSGVLLSTGRLSEAYERVSEVFELDSTAWRSNTMLAEYHEFTGNLPEALRLYQRAMQIYERALPQGGSSYRARVDYPRVLARLSRDAEARQHLSQLQAEALRTGSHDPTVATLFFALGDMDGALAWLERSYRERHPLMRFIGGFPIFIQAFEGDPRYRDLLRRIGLRR